MKDLARSILEKTLPLAYKALVGITEGHKLVGIHIACVGIEGKNRQTDCRNERYDGTQRRLYPGMTK